MTTWITDPTLGYPIYSTSYTTAMTVAAVTGFYQEAMAQAGWAADAPDTQTLIFHYGRGGPESFIGYTVQIVLSTTSQGPTHVEVQLSGPGIGPEHGPQP